MGHDKLLRDYQKEDAAYVADVEWQLIHNCGHRRLKFECVAEEPVIKPTVVRSRGVRTYSLGGASGRVE
jgi:hypothetical protein